MVISISSVSGFHQEKLESVAQKVGIIAGGNLPVTRWAAAVTAKVATGMRTTNARKALRGLEERGMIPAIGGTGGGRDNPIRYGIHPAKATPHPLP